MTVEDTNEIEEVRRQAERLGIGLPEASRSPLPIAYGGHGLPPAFVWFCSHWPGHPGFPNDRVDRILFGRPGSKEPFGMLSPFGVPSELTCWNDRLREIAPQWPAKWVSFWHGGDGDYCFSFDRQGHPWVVYWYYNASYGEVEGREFEDDYDSVGFVDWFARQVEWTLATDNGDHSEGGHRALNAWTHARTHSDLADS